MIKVVNRPPPQMVFSSLKQGDVFEYVDGNDSGIYLRTDNPFDAEADRITNPTTVCLCPSPERIGDGSGFAFGPIKDVPVRFLGRLERA